MSRPTQLASGIALALALVPLASAASELNYTLYTGLERSDNIQLVDTNPISQTALIPGFNFSLVQQGATIQANVVGDMQYRDYLGSRFSSQTQTSLAGTANWSVLPKRLDLTLDDYASVQPVDYLVSDAPSNQQQINVLSVGPTLHFRVGDGFDGQAELRYINSYAQKTKDFDSQRGLAALRLERQLNPTGRLSFNAEQHRVVFNNLDQGKGDYNDTDLYARYVSRLAQMDIDAALGWSRITFSQPVGGAETSPLARLSLIWHATDRSTFGAIGSRQYSDAAEGLMQPTTLGGTTSVGGVDGGINGGINGSSNTGDITVTSEVYLERSAEVNYSYRTARLQFTLAPRYSRLTYKEAPVFDQTVRELGAGLDYKLSPSVTVSGYYQKESRFYQTLGRTDRSTGYIVGLTRRINMHWSWRVNFTRRWRTSDVPAAGFNENRVYLGVSYTR
ncbi:MAG TPA: outer membrane beta-barrel protein [Rhodanobacter sp.]|nr:outer membrane beta-barrel protein [Rhodanobacter sp.]